MNWSTVGKLLATVAPIAGSIVGGLIPIPGGSLVGQKLGEIIARQFGIPANLPASEKADQLAIAIKQADAQTIIAKTNAAMEIARAEIAGFAQVEAAAIEAQARINAQINETMRLELQPEIRHWFFTGWRPAAGWSFICWINVWGFILSVALMLAVFGGKPGPLQEIAAAWPVLAAYLVTLLAVVGVNIIARSADKAKGVDTSGVKPK
jgi:hypothetical protein